MSDTEEIEIIPELRGKDPATLTETQHPEELRGKTPEQLHQLVEVLDAHLRSIHQEDNGALRDLTSAEDKAFRYGLRLRELALAKIEEHRAISEVFSRRPNAVKTAYANIRNGLDSSTAVTRMLNSEARDAALRVLDDRRASAHLRPEEKDLVERHVRRNTDVARRIIVTENDAYRSAWLKLVTQPDGMMLLEDDERAAMRAFAEYRAMSSTNAAGGFGVPVKLAA